MYIFGFGIVVDGVLGVGIIPDSFAFFAAFYAARFAEPFRF